MPLKTLKYWTNIIILKAISVPCKQNQPINRSFTKFNIHLGFVTNYKPAFLTGESQPHG